MELLLQLSIKAAIHLQKSREQIKKTETSFISFNITYRYNAKNKLRLCSLGTWLSKHHNRPAHRPSSFTMTVEKQLQHSLEDCDSIWSSETFWRSFTYIHMYSQVVGYVPTDLLKMIIYLSCQSIKIASYILSKFSSNFCKFCLTHSYCSMWNLHVFSKQLKTKSKHAPSEKKGASQQDAQCCAKSHIGPERSPRFVRPKHRQTHKHMCKQRSHEKRHHNAGTQSPSPRLAGGSDIAQSREI